MLKSKIKKLLFSSCALLLSVFLLLIFGQNRPLNTNNNPLIYDHQLKNQALSETIVNNGRIYRKSVEQFNALQQPGYISNNNFNGLKLANGGYIFISKDNDNMIYRTDLFYNTLWTYRFANNNQISRHVVEVAYDTYDPTTFYVLTVPRNNDDNAIRAYANGSKDGFGVITKIKENLDRELDKRADLQSEIAIDPQALLNNIPSTWNSNPSFLSNTIGFTNNGKFIFSYNNYLANLANLIVYKQNIYLIGGNGNINPTISDRFQSLGIFRIDKNLNQVTGWPYAVLIGGWSQTRDSNFGVNLPIFQDAQFTYVIRGAIAGGGIISDTDQLQIGGSWSVGDHNVLSATNREIPKVSNNSSNLQLLGTFRLNLSVLDSLGSFVSPTAFMPTTDLKRTNPNFLLVSGSQDFNFNNNNDLFNNQRELMVKSRLYRLDNTNFYHSVAGFSYGSVFGSFSMQFNDLTIIFDTNDTYTVIQPPLQLQRLFGFENNQYQWDNFVNSLSSANYNSLSQSQAGNTIIIFWSKKEQNVNNKVSTVYLIDNKDNGYRARIVPSINQSFLDQTQQISDNSSFGVYPISNVVSLNGIDDILVYLNSNNANFKALSLFKFSSDRVIERLIIDNNYQDPVATRTSYLGSGELLLNPENDDLFTFTVQELIEPYRGDFKIKDQYIDKFIKYTPGINNPRPDLVLLIKNDNLDLKTQSFRMESIVKNPLVNNYFETVPGLDFKYRYFGFGANPTWVFSFIVISSIVFFVPLVWLGIIFVLRFYGFSVRDYIQIQKRKQNNKKILSAFKATLEDAEASDLISNNKNQSLVEKQYSELMNMIDLARYRHIKQQQEIYIYESSVVSKNDKDDLGIRLLKTKLQLLQRYFIDQGIKCYRYNLKDHKEVFLNNPKLITHLKNTDFKLPVIMDHNDILHYGSYPSNKELASLFGINLNVLKKIDALTWQIVHSKNSYSFYNSPKFSNVYVEQMTKKNVRPPQKG
ncbi:cytadherence-related molecule (crmB)-like protein [Mycoplasmoides gallisepticum str. R(high)]|uniref:arsenic metallochaperone ArsD family protein n=1 Tax=Mycoplasmoides gallisepticum TaxID=2096 RepID=UPI0001C398C5|nr:arsenic metallochaperone ArsD family protein [Mycoplasmoides gallisepticum]ADC30472.1 cytadherence-related molecule (crmB)-like protein [Mycoplasmoides gallisepticum str. R(high)]